MADHPTIKVTIDKVSNSGNPIAKEKYSGDNINVYGAEPGETVEIELGRWRGLVVGIIINPTDEQAEKSKIQIREQKSRVETNKKQTKNKKSHPHKQPFKDPRKHSFGNGSIFGKSKPTRNELLNGKL